MIFTSQISRNAMQQQKLKAMSWSFWIGSESLDCTKRQITNYSKALSYMASRCTNLADTRFFRLSPCGVRTFWHRHIFELHGFFLDPKPMHISRPYCAQLWMDAMFVQAWAVTKPGTLGCTWARWMKQIWRWQAPRKPDTPVRYT